MKNIFLSLSILIFAAIGVAACGGGGGGGGVSAGEGEGEGQDASVELCSNGVDDDGDSFPDCQDADCLADAACEVTDPLDPVEVCNDGADNDGDGATDCGDGDCASLAGCEAGSVSVPIESLCADSLDNDSDGAADCGDSDCSAVDTCVDADGDGVVAAADCSDADASIYPGAFDEIGDGVDSDCDGAQDIIATTAGGGLQGTADATALALYRPANVAFDPTASGLVYYVADTDAHLVRKVYWDSGVALWRTAIVAGTGAPGDGGDGGDAIAASLQNPAGVAVDGSQALYIADTGNHRVRKVDLSTGLMATIAGTGEPRYSGNGTSAISARLNSPHSVAVDGAGVVYIADTQNNRIRQVSAGVIVTVAGTGEGAWSGDGGPAADAALNSPYGVAVKSDGTIYIADTDNHRVRRVSGGIISSVAGNGQAGSSGDGGAATGAKLRAPMGIEVAENGDFYIADTGNSRIRKVTASSGRIATVAGDGEVAFEGDGASARSASLAYPQGVVLDDLGNFYIADTENQRIRRVKADQSIETAVGVSGSGDGALATAAQLRGPCGVARDSAGTLYIADVENHRIRKVDGSGLISTVAGTGIADDGGDGGLATDAALRYPSAVALDLAGNLYVADVENHRIRKVDGSGLISTVAGTGIAGDSGDGGSAIGAALNYPSGVAVDGAGVLYIADTGNNRVRTVDLGGAIQAFAGTGVAGYSGDEGPAMSALLNNPESIALDNLGHVYIADTWNDRVRRVDGAGMISTVAGNGNYGFSGDGGPATAAALASPMSLVLDPFGVLYIADRDNARVRKVENSGTISTVAGVGTEGYSGDGEGSAAALLFQPCGLSLSADSGLDIAEQGNHRVRHIDP